MHQVGPCTRWRKPVWRPCMKYYIKELEVVLLFTRLYLYNPCTIPWLVVARFCVFRFSKMRKSRVGPLLNMLRRSWYCKVIVVASCVVHGFHHQSNLDKHWNSFGKRWCYTAPLSITSFIGNASLPSRVWISKFAWLQVSLQHHGTKAKVQHPGGSFTAYSLRMARTHRPG